MTNEEKVEKIKEILKDQDVLIILSVDNINHKPHPYCVTEKHITQKYMYLNDRVIRELEEKKIAHCGMYVNPDTGEYTNGYKKGWSPCNIPYDEHTSDNIAFLQLLRNCTDDEVREVMMLILDLPEEERVDGFIFVETEEKYRIL